MLLDSNIIIYSVEPARDRLREFIAIHSPAVSAVSYLEVLGYHRLTDADRSAFNEFFSVAVMLPIDRPVLDRAVSCASSDACRSAMRSLRLLPWFMRGRS